VSARLRGKGVAAVIAGDFVKSLARQMTLYSRRIWKETEGNSYRLFEVIIPAFAWTE
jgi:hypothetical protein